MKKEEYKDWGLRQALQRRNEDAERRTLSEDFTDRLMERIAEQEQKPMTNPRRSWIYTLIGAAAASIVLLLTFHFLNNSEVTKVEQPVVMKKTEHQGSKSKAIEKEPMPMTKEEKAVVAQTTRASKRTQASE